MKTLAGLFVLLVMLQLPVYSQTVHIESEKGPGVLPPSMQDYYHNVSASGSIALQGRIHSGAYPAGSGHPFFGSGAWTKASVQLRGGTFHLDYVRYDLLNDNLQLQHFSPSGPLVINLEPGEVIGFRVEGQEFRRLGGGNDLSGELLAAYYLLLHDAGLPVWKRLTVRFTERSSGQGSYRQEHKVYLQKGKQFLEVRNRKTLLAALGDHEKELAVYLRKKRFNVREASPGQWAEMIHFYLHLQP